MVFALTKLDEDLTGGAELFELAREEGDDDTIEAVEADTAGMRAIVEDMEFRRMFSGPMDAANCFIDIRPAPAAPRRATGPRCCCANT